MERVYTDGYKEDKQMLTIMHVSQLLNLISLIGGLIVPLILWLTQKDKVAGMDEQGKMILNFQISLYIYSIICIPLIFLFGLGFFLLGIIWLMSIILPIVNAIKVNNGEEPDYPFAIEIIK